MAKTGSGKTLAFALPILQTLSADPYGVYAVILTPTRELAYQISDQFNIIGVGMGLRTCVVVGGRDMVMQSKVSFLCSVQFQAVSCKIDNGFIHICHLQFSFPILWKELSAYFYESSISLALHFTRKFLNSCNR